MYLRIASVLVCAALVASAVWGEPGRPDRDPPSNGGVQSRGDGASSSTDDADSDPAAGSERVRRRETIRYQPSVGSELRYVCTMNGRATIRFMGEKSLVGGADMAQRVDRIEPDGMVYVSTFIQNGRAALGEKKEYHTEDRLLVAQFDALHQMHKVERVPTEEEKAAEAAGDAEDDKEEAIDLATILLYLLTSVDYHERSMGVGTKWQTTHTVIDANGKQITMGGSNELVGFLFDGKRRVAVIHSLFDIPVRGRSGTLDLQGSLACDVISEVYIDTGEIRHRRAVSNGEMKPSGSLLPIKIDISNLETVMAVVLPDQRPAAALWSPGAAGTE